MAGILEKMIRSQYHLKKHHDDIEGRNELVSVIAEAKHESSKIKQQPKGL